MNKLAKEQLINENLIRLYGRYSFDERGLLFGFSFSGFLVKFKGTCLRASFDGNHFDEAENAPSVATYIDKDFLSVEDLNGTIAFPINTKDEIVLAEGLPNGVHTLMLRKQSEAIESSLILKELVTDGEILPTGQRKKRLFIEYYGDSYTCAFGLLGRNRDCSDNNTYDELVARGYACLTSSSLGGEMSIVAVSGYPIGISPWINDGVKIRDIPSLFSKANFSFDYESLITDWDNSKATPDIVVVNLGANDRCYQEERPDDSLNGLKAIERNYNAFLDKLLLAYPLAKILMLSFENPSDNPALDKINEVYSSRKEKERIFRLNAPINPNLEYTNAWHPGVEQHQELADAVVRFIKENIL